MVAGESPSKLARELGIRRKFLYAWNESGKGTVKPPPKPPKAKPDAKTRENQRLKAKIAQLHRLNGEQAAELDFFAAALRSIKELRPNSGARSGKGSTR
jgi:hypothetical protein